MVGGVLATAGDLVFCGEMDGISAAFHARSGRKLWRFNLGVAVGAPPITYRVNNVQYVAVAAGWAVRQCVAAVDDTARQATVRGCHRHIRRL